MNDLMSLVFYSVAFLISAICIQLGLYEKKSKIFTIIGLTIPIIIAALRYAVGTDYFNYLFVMNNTGKLNFYEYLTQNYLNELGSYFLYRIGYLSGSYNLMLGIIATLTILPVYFSLKKEKELLSVSIGILIYLFIYFPISFNIMMQMIAVSITTLSWRYIFEKKLFRFILTIFIASSFHSTALIFIPIYFLNNTKKKQRIINIKYILAVILCLFLSLHIESILASFEGSELLSEYSVYATTDYVGNNRDILIKIILFAILFIFRKDLIKYDKKNSLFILFLFLNIIIGLTGSFSPFIKRIGIYFEIVQIYILTMLIRISKNKSERLLRGMIICLYAICLFILTAYILGQADIIPYRINL